MAEHIGIVLEVDTEGYARVVSDRKSACGGCQPSGSGCHSCLANSKMVSKVINPSSAGAGDIDRDVEDRDRPDPVDAEHPVVLGAMTPTGEIPVALVAEDAARVDLAPGELVAAEGVVLDLDPAAVADRPAQCVEGVLGGVAQTDLHGAVGALAERELELRQRP